MKRHLIPGLALSLTVALMALGGTMRSPVSHTFAAITTPPPLPPTPPLPTATATPLPPVPTTTPTPTATVNPALRFSLDAARVDKVGSAGNKRGMNVVRPGQKLWLMMYYTEYSIPRKLTRVTAYQIQQGTSIVFKIAFKGPVGAGETGSKVRYVPMTMPLTAPSGLYVYRAILTIGGRSQQRMWRFAVIKTGPGIIPTGYTVQEGDGRPGR